MSSIHECILPKTCEWHVSTKPYRMCGQTTKKNKSYCEEHYRRAYVQLDEVDIESYYNIPQIQESSEDIL